MIELKEPNVVFDESNHTYTNANGKQLSGVTALLKRQLFADKYSGVSEATLARAAERGNLIHRQIEMYETFHGGALVSPELEAYVRLRDEWGFTAIATELLVSDDENVASAIDLVFDKDDLAWLWDTKTTSSLDKEYLSWQLSIYKYLFLLKNPKAKVGGLGVCWLPKPQYGTPKMMLIEEKPMEWVKDLIETDARGEKWTNPEAALLAEKERSLDVPQELTKTIADILYAEKQAKEAKEQLRLLMEKHGITKWSNDDFVATIGQPSTTASFDSKAFQAAEPELYNKYLKTTTKKGSFRVTLKK